MYLFCMYEEMLDAAFRICGSLESICCIGDGDTGPAVAVLGFQVSGENRSGLGFRV